MRQRIWVAALTDRYARLVIRTGHNVIHSQQRAFKDRERQQAVQQPETGDAERQQQQRAKYVRHHLAATLNAVLASCKVRHCLFRLWFGKPKRSAGKVNVDRAAGAGVLLVMWMDPD